MISTGPHTSVGEGDESLVPLGARLDAYRHWIIDFATDPRRPHLIPWTLHKIEHQARLQRSRTPINKDTVGDRPAVLVTFDIERDSDQPYVSSVSRTARPFIEAFLAVAEARGYRATFYVQGGMVEGLGDVLREAESQHEVGMHGYHHELWGARNWITRRIPATPVARQTLMSRGLQAFQQAALRAPKSFRAPNFTADHHTYDLLQSFAFHTDSSIPTQRGHYAMPSAAGITIIPVSVAPTPVIYRNPVLRVATSLHFCQFNYTTTIASPRAEFERRVAELFAWQQACNRPQELVLYAHNWEFFDLRSARAVANEGLNEFVRRLDWLAETYNARFYTMAEWAPRRGVRA